MIVCCIVVIPLLVGVETCGRLLLGGSGDEIHIFFVIVVGRYMS